jgi:ATP-dependent DNA helicase PIF1
MRNELPFGGKAFLALGDFRQVAPVLQHITAPAVVFDSSIRSSSLWRHFHALRLTRPIRNAADPAYADWIDDLLFFDHVLLDPSQSIRRSFLSPLNLHVDNFNQLMMGCLPGSAGRFFATFSCDFLLSHLRTLTFSETYLSCDSVKEIKDTAYRLPPALHGEYIALLSEPGVPPHKLRLKVGAICSVMRNLCIEKGLVKNVRVRVAELHRHIVRVELLRDQSIPIDDRFFYLPRISFDFQPRQTSWTVERRQFPLRLAYATAFNSCQGLTLDKVVLDLTTPVFAHGQLYTPGRRLNCQTA